MKRTLFSAALAAAAVLMQTAFAQTPPSALLQLAPGQSLGLGTPTVPLVLR